MMKRTVILALAALCGFALGCATTHGISRQRAVELATEKAMSSGWKPDEYVLEWVKPMMFQGRQYWDLFFEGKVQAVGNHFGVWVDQETGECKIFPGM